MSAMKANIKLLMLLGSLHNQNSIFINQSNIKSKNINLSVLKTLDLSECDKAKR